MLAAMSRRAVSSSGLTSRVSRVWSSGVSAAAPSAAGIIIGAITRANSSQAAWSGAGNAAALTAYVQGGGHVMVMGGTGQNGSGATAWAPFLNTFGLGCGSAYFAVPPGGAPLQISATPLPNAATQGLTSISWSFGSTALDLNPSDPANQVALWGNFSSVVGQTLPANPAQLPVIATWNIPTPSAAAGLVLGIALTGRRRR